MESSNVATGVVAHHQAAFKGAICKLYRGFLSLSSNKVFNM